MGWKFIDDFRIFKYGFSFRCELKPKVHVRWPLLNFMCDHHHPPDTIYLSTARHPLVSRVAMCHSSVVEDAHLVKKKQQKCVQRHTIYCSSLSRGLRPAGSHLSSIGRNIRGEHTDVHIIRSLVFHGTTIHSKKTVLQQQPHMVWSASLISPIHDFKIPPTKLKSFSDGSSSASQSVTHSLNGQSSPERKRK